MEVFAEGEDAHVFRLESKLSDLQTEHANSFVHTHEWIRIEHVDKKRTDNHKGCLFFFGRSVEIRTPGLQYPKLARYQLRYTSKILEITYKTTEQR